MTVLLEYIISIRVNLITISIMLEIMFDAFGYLHSYIMLEITIPSHHPVGTTELVFNKDVKYIISLFGVFLIGIHSSTVCKNIN